MSEAETLLARARAAAQDAYAPYSRFRVGAVVVAEDGRLFTGANVENAAYGSSVCAEANAITTAVAAGARKLATLAVACLDGPGCFPCGNCRQLMREFGVERVVVEEPGAGALVVDLADLLPRAFGPEAL